MDFEREGSNIGTQQKETVCIALIILETMAATEYMAVYACFSNSTKGRAGRLEKFRDNAGRFVGYNVIYMSLTVAETALGSGSLPPREP